MSDSQNRLLLTETVRCFIDERQRSVWRSLGRLSGWPRRVRIARFVTSQRRHEVVITHRAVDELVDLLTRDLNLGGHRVKVECVLGQFLHLAPELFRVFPKSVLLGEFDGVLEVGVLDQSVGTSGEACKGLDGHTPQGRPIGAPSIVRSRMINQLSVADIDEDWQGSRPTVIVKTSPVTSTSPVVRGHRRNRRCTGRDHHGTARSGLRIRHSKELTCTAGRYAVIH
jgi:hypothetical protein